MNGTMSKRRTKPEPAPESPEPLVVYLRLDLPTSIALTAFVESQDVAPTNPAVVLKALHEFLERRGHWPPKAG